MRTSTSGLSGAAHAQAVIGIIALFASPAAWADNKVFHHPMEAALYLAASVIPIVIIALSIRPLISSGQHEKLGKRLAGGLLVLIIALGILSLNAILLILIYPLVVVALWMTALPVSSLAYFARTAQKASKASAETSATDTR